MTLISDATTLSFVILVMLQAVTDPHTSRVVARPTGEAIVKYEGITPRRQPLPVAARSKGNRIVNQNETYNLGRLSEGRVGIRVGNDSSYRINRKAGE